MTLTFHTFVALDTLTAAQLNAMQSNAAVSFVGTTAGDIDYYSSGTAKARLAKGTAYQTLRMKSDGSAAPEWANNNAIHATASTTYNTSINTTSAFYVDVTSATVNITTAVTCDIWALFQGSIANGSAGFTTNIIGVIDGTNDPQSQIPSTTNPYFVPFFYLYRRAAVAAKTNMVIKLQYAAPGGGTAYINGGAIHVLAINS